MKEFLLGICKFCVFLFFPQKADRNRYAEGVSDSDLRAGA